LTGNWHWLKNTHLSYLLSSLEENMITPESEFDNRLRAIRTRMGNQDLDLLLIFSSPGSMRYGQRGHVLYVTGYEPYFGDTMFLLPRDEENDYLLEIDSADHFASVNTWVDQDHVVEARDHVQAVKDYLSKQGMTKAKIGIVGDYSMSPQTFNRLCREVDAEIVVASSLLEEERMVKSAYELDCIQKAGAIAQKGMQAAARFARAGVLEADITGEIERACRAEGSEFFPHYTMVTSGKDPDHLNMWWKCGKRKLEPGDAWSLDYGTMYQNYCCDVARPFSLGPPPKQSQELSEILTESLEAGRKAARPGVMTSEVNEATAEVVRSKLGKDAYCKRVGHGVGLEVHEWPFVGYDEIIDDGGIYRDVELRANMVISMEPTFHLEGLGDMQVEDQFVVTEEGGQKMSPIPLEIMVCDD
jgi:Xaa-Pro aminopeptidase